MSCQDDLSQLMPSLYSRVRLGAHSDSTADLARYAQAHPFLAHPFLAHPSSPLLSSSKPLIGQRHPQQQQQQQQQQHLQRTCTFQQQLSSQHGGAQRHGTGRAVGQRTFSLELRLPAAGAQGRLTAPAEDTGNLPHSPAAQIEVSTKRKKLQDVSNLRCSQLEQRKGSGRIVSKRTFDLSIAHVQFPPVSQAGSETPSQPSYSTPQAAGTVPSAQRLSAHTSRSSRASVGSAMEGIPERPWRSIAKTPAVSRLTAASTIFQYTPMEGVPERTAAAASQPSIRRQSNAGKLRTPASARQTPDKQAGMPAAAARQDAAVRLQLLPGDEAQLQEVSPVAGLLESQEGQGPDQQQQQTGAERYGSMRFFGSLCSAPPIDTSGCSMPDEDGRMDMEGYEDFSDDPDKPLMPSPMVQQHSIGQDSAACASDEATPASWQQPCSIGRLVLPLYSTAGQRNSPWAAGSDQLQRYGSPRFHEMEVQTGASLQNSPMPPQADAVLAHSPAAEQPSEYAEQDGGEQAEVQAAVASVAKAVHKGEAHQRLKEYNRQRRSLAGEGLHGERGVRRSSRDKHAPLQYWRNERKVYNREFRSLPTVHHYATRTPSPSWKFVQDLPHRKRSRFAQGKAAEDK